MKRALVLTALSLGFLAACGASPPPGKELAEEMIGTLDVSDDVKDCMRAAVDEFSLTEGEATGFENFDDVASKAADGNEQALQILARFESQLAACN